MRRFAFGGARFVLPPLLALLLAVLAYQAPARTRVDVGALGDQLFLPSSEAQREQQIADGAWYADQLDAGAGRSRWSRERAVLRLPGLGAGRDLRLTLDLAGWPEDVVRDQPAQPEVQVLVGGRELGRFVPTPDVASYSFDVPAELRSSADLEATLIVSPTFTDTAAFRDQRPKGIRLDAVAVAPVAWGARPDWGVALSLALAAGLAMLVVPGAVRRSRSALIAGAAFALFAAAGLLAARAWVAAALPAVLVALAVAAVAANWPAVRAAAGYVGRRLLRGRALDYALLAALLGLLVATLLPRLVQASFPDSGLLRSELPRHLLTLAVLWGGTALLVFASITLLPRHMLRLRHALLRTRLAPALLLLAVAAWLGYLVWVLWTVPVIGHADYADNAVVARNLLRGRGWVVDYVTQFYRLEPDGTVTRPQETWPLLQPLLMLPAMALLGPTPFAARLVNLPLLAALAALIYAAGARFWDRRVGLLAALLVLVNVLFFRLAIYASSDLALVVWSFAAYWLAFAGVERTIGTARHPAVDPYLLASGLFIGLMILQKPSAAIMAVGMGLWALWRLERWRRQTGAGWRQVARGLVPIAAWAGVALLVVSPYLIRNLLEFGRLFFSTEAWDAWIIYFRGTRPEAWEDIYKVYAPELGGPGVPDRSWILRWGWDLTLSKIAQQARDAWAFFMPTRGTLLNYDVDGVVLTWLMLAGVVALRGRQRRLIGLVAAALVPYILFLIVYWHTHDEPRYFVVFVPWLALLAAAGVCAIFDRLAALADGRWAALAGLALGIALLAGVAPHWREIDATLDRSNPRYYGRLWDRSLLAWEWLRANTPPDAVIMTRVPWQLNYYADRPALMTPNAGDRETIRQIARYYGARYLVTNSISTSEAERSVLRPLTSGEQLPGYRLVHEIRDPYPGGASVYVYRIE